MAQAIVLFTSSPTTELRIKQMNNTPVNRSALITALYNEYKFLCHDDFDPEVDPTPDEYLLMLQHLSDDELVYEASADDINEFISNYA